MTLPRLLTATARLPGVRLAVRQASRNTVADMIDRGEVDLGLAAAPATAPPPPASLKRIVAASVIGTTIEWYDNSFGRG